MNLLVQTRVKRALPLLPKLCASSLRLTYFVPAACAVRGFFEDNRMGTIQRELQEADLASLDVLLLRKANDRSSR